MTDKTLEAFEKRFPKFVYDMNNHALAQYTEHDLKVMFIAWQAPLTSCASNRDGECDHAQCPQLRDGEPLATGRHCPLDSAERGRLYE